MQPNELYSFLHHWYNLSDYELEKAIDDRLSFRRFVGLDYTQCVPDHSSFSRFRDELVKYQLDNSLFNELSQQIERGGFVIKQGTLIDASILQADVKKPKPKSNGEGALKMIRMFLGQKSVINLTSVTRCILEWIKGVG